MKTPKRNTTLKRSRKRSHLPALSPAARTIINERLNAIPLMQSTRDTVMASLNAAANKDAETPRVVIDSLSHEEKALIVPFEAGYSAIFDVAGARGRNALMMDMELDSMIARENDEE